MPIVKTKTAPKKSKLTILSAKNFAGIPWLVHGFSTRMGGHSKAYGGTALNLGFTERDTKRSVEQNRADFFKKLGATDRNGLAWPLVSVRQIHSDHIHCVEAPFAVPVAGDGLITQAPRLLLAIRTADCLPVIIVDPETRVIGVFHAGWRGTFSRIVEKGVGEMRKHFNSDPTKLKAAIGPGIHKCCYQVGEDLPDKFAARFAYSQELFHETQESDEIRDRYPMLFLTSRAPGHSELPKKVFLDLFEANRRQLLDVGVQPSNIDVSPLCTSCRTDLLFSHRAEKGNTGRMMAVAGIRP